MKDWNLCFLVYKTFLDYTFSERFFSTPITLSTDPFCCLRPKIAYVSVIYNVYLSSTTATFNPAANEFTPRSSEASLLPTTSGPDQPAATMNSILGSGTWSTSNMNTPKTSASADNNTVVVNGVTYVRADKEPTTPNGVKQSVNDGSSHMNGNSPHRVV